MAKPTEQTFQYTIAIGAKLTAGLRKTMATAGALVKDFRQKLNAASVQMAKSAGVSAARFAKDFAFEYSDAISALKRNTGALGKAFAPTEKALGNVMAKIPLNVGKIGQAVGDVSTLLKYEGKELEDTVVKFGKLSQVTGQDVGDIVSAAALLQKRWGLSQKQLMQFTETAYKSVLSTGLSFDELSGAVARNSEALRRLGFDANQGILLLSNFKNAGIDADRVFQALSKDTELSADDFRDWALAIQRANTDEEALRLGVDAFGKQSAPEMVKAIRAGTFALSEMQKQFDADSVSIDKMSKETQTWEETITIISNSLKTLLLPVLTKISEKIKEALDWWRGANGQALVDKVSKALANFKTGYFASDEELQAAAEKRMYGGLPQKAAGGWVSSPSIAGEAGPEAVISMNPAYRAANLRTWAEAGQALGVGGLTVNVNGLSFSPTVNGAAGVGVLDELRAQSREFASLVAGAIQANIQRSF